MYQLFNEDKAVDQTSYILQFLWRDLTSSYDIIGPYFTSSDTCTAKFIHVCVMETIQLFQVCSKYELVIYIYIYIYIHNAFYLDTWICDQSAGMRWSSTKLNHDKVNSWCFRGL